MPVDPGVLLQAGLLAGVAYLMLRSGGCCGVPVRPPPAGDRHPDPGTVPGAKPAQPAQNPVRAPQVQPGQGQDGAKTGSQRA